MANGTIRPKARVGGHIALALLLLMACASAKAQKEKACLISVGHVDILDTYLSQEKATGLELRYNKEMLNRKLVACGDTASTRLRKWSTFVSQEALVSKAGTRGNSNSFLGAMYNLRLGWHYNVDRSRLNVRFGLLGDEDRRIIRQVMDMVNVTAIKDQDFTRISDGQRQRVMLARAICQEPEIIVLDEPTSYLDVRYKLEFLSILQRMKREKNLTVIMSLHELELAERVSDKILCINGRYVDRYGTPREIFTRGYISDLFSIESGSYDEESEDMELVRQMGSRRSS